MAKRILKIIGTLVLAGVIYAGGAYILPDYSILSTPAPLPPPTYMPETPDPVYTELGTPAIVEYGNPFIASNNSNPLHAYIRYPQAGNPTDSEIEQWSHSLLDDMLVRYSTGVEFDPIDYGEINVHYNSYLIDNRYAGIHQFGEFSYTTTEEPLEIVKTFNIDLTVFEFLEPGDILDLDEYADFVLSLLRLRLLVEHPKTDGYIDFMDESWLANLLITHEGVKVILPFNEFLPDSFATLIVTLPYEDLGSSLLIRRSAPLPAVPTPTPDSTPEPTSMPTPSPNPDGSPNDSSDTDEDDGSDSNGDSGDTDDDADNDADNTDSETDSVDTDDDADNDTEGDPDSDPDNGASGDPGDGSDDTSGEEPPPTVPPQGSKVDPDKPAIALTFDDGPGAFTEELLDLLKQYGARATFFTVGNLSDSRADTLRRAIDLNCEVAGHSWNHKNLAKMNADDVRLQLETTNSTIELITGVAPSFYRPPYGAVSDTMKTVSEELGLSMINWSIDSEDWKNKDSDQIYEIIMQQIEDKAIILSHDVYQPILDVYERIIPELLLDGYQLVTVSELMKLEYGQLTPGQSYYSGHKVEQMVG